MTACLKPHCWVLALGQKWLTQSSDGECRPDELGMMKQDAILINFARGEVIDKQVRLSIA